MTLIFNNGQSIEFIESFATEEYFNGSSRRTLTIHIPSTVSIDRVNNLASSEENTSKIVLKNGEFENIFDGYVLKLSVGIQPIVVSDETPESPAVYEDRLILKLGKRTYIEEQLHKLGLN